MCNRISDGRCKARRTSRFLSAGAGVDAYVLDSGLDPTSGDFGLRVDRGVDEVGDGRGTQDCDGHGTAVAGIIGGNFYGVAKQVNLVPVRIAGCAGGDIPGHRVLDGINWVYNRVIDPKTHAPTKPSVIQLSIAPACQNGICPAETPAVNEAVKKVVDAGIPVVASAGNENTDACTVNAVAATLEAITVGAVDQFDARWVDPSSGHGSNFGPCVDLWAPGQGIDTDALAGQGHATVSGSSFASPFVTGAVALLLSTPQFAHASVSAIEDQLRGTATKDVLKASTLGTGSPNLMLYTGAALPSNGPAIALTAQKDGRLALFGVNNDGFIFNRNQMPDSTSWGGWTHSRDRGFFSVAAQLGGAGRISLAGLQLRGQLWDRHQVVPSISPTNDGENWGNWRSLDGSATAMAPNDNGRMMLFDIGQGQLHGRMQIPTDPTQEWGAPFPVVAPQGVTFRFVASALGAGGLIEVAAIDTKGQVWMTRQTQRNVAGFDPFNQMRPTLIDITASEIALARNQHGKLLIVATDGRGGFFTGVESGPETGIFNGWIGLVDNPNKTFDHIAAGTNAAPDNRIVIVASDRDGNIWQLIQTAPNDNVDFSGWTQIDGQFRP